LLIVDRTETNQSHVGQAVFQQPVLGKLNAGFLDEIHDPKQHRLARR
jgi:hypothetical protein